MKRLLIVLALSIGSLGLITTTVVAADPEAAELRQAIQTARQEAEQKIAQEKEHRTVLSGDQLTACNHQQIAINRLMKRTISQNKAQLQTFQTIARRVQAYVATSQLQVNDYDELTGIVTQNYIAASARLEATDATPFACSYQQPSSIGIGVSEALRAQHATLTNYRLSIQTLISAVKEAQ